MDDLGTDRKRRQQSRALQRFCLNQPLRSEAPSCGWHTIAAEVPAQNGSSSSSQNETNRARQTEAQSRKPKSKADPRRSAHPSRSRLIEAMSRSCASRCVPESIMLRVSAVAPLLEQNALRAAQTSMRGRQTSPRLVVHRRRPRQAGNVLPAGGDEQR